MTVAGLSAPVEIIRDADAIPHIFAANKRDAPVRPRLRARAGSAVADGVPAPRSATAGCPKCSAPRRCRRIGFLRTVGFGRAARAAWASTPDWAKQQVDAYVAGVNAFIATHHGSRAAAGVHAAPLRARAVDRRRRRRLGEDDGVGPERATTRSSCCATISSRAVGAERDGAADAAVRARTGSSILAGQVIGQVGRWVGQVGQAPCQAVPARRASYQHPRWSRAVRARGVSRAIPPVRDFLLGSAQREGLGSNNWVVDGTLTASGKPLLANDPHLGTRLPVHLVSRARDRPAISRSSARRCPARRRSRSAATDSIAWGATNVAADVEDLYRERLDATGTHAEFRGEQEPITVIPETIVVKGGRAGPRRRARHAPRTAASPTRSTRTTRRRSATPKPPPIEPLAFRWTALDADDDDASSAFLKLNEARNWDEFTDGAACDSWSPSQNFVYADVDGHIGYYAPGDIPMRASAATDRGRPTAGAATPEWTGWIPFDELPHLYDPPEHFIVTANHRPGAAVVSATSSASIGPSRIARSGIVGSAARESRKFARRTTSRASRPTPLSLHAKALLPLLLRTRARSTTAISRAADTVLRRGISTPAPTAPRRRSSRPGFCSSRRRSSPTTSARWSRTAIRAASRSSTRFLIKHADVERLAVVRQHDDAGGRNLRRRGDAGAAAKGVADLAAAASATAT